LGVGSKVLEVRDYRLREDVFEGVQAPVGVRRVALVLEFRGQCSATSLRVQGSGLYQV